MVTMAEVLAEHRLGHTVGYAVHCACDPEVGYSPDVFYRHQGEALVAAGYGSLVKVRKLATDMAALCPPDDWPENGAMADAAVADFGRALLAALDGGA